MSYEESAWVYDLFWPRVKSYADEAETIRELAGAPDADSRPSLLDVACGTGQHDRFLTRWYDVVGLDFSPAMLEQARRRLPDVEYHHGDMTDFDLGRQFDVVTCLFGSLGHLMSAEAVSSAITSMVKHLAPGGTILLEPVEMPAEPMIDTMYVDTHDFHGTMMLDIRPADNEFCDLEMHYLASGAGIEGVKHAVHENRFRLCAMEDCVSLLERNGVTAAHEPDATPFADGLVVGVKE